MGRLSGFFTTSSAETQQHEAMAATNKKNTPTAALRTPKANKALPLRPRSASRDAARGAMLFQPQDGDAFQDDLIAAQSQSSASPRRSRMNSRDIPRSYSGLYGFSDDLLPFELNRHRGNSTATAWFVAVYLTLCGAVQLLSLALTDLDRSWTVTNLVHLAVTMAYVHWLKGSLYDEQGEMNALTVWEQLEATQGTKPVRQVLLVVPTALCYAACHFCGYEIRLCVINVVVWLVGVLAKLPFMNGVRIFGINRTAGIDDDDHDGDSAVKGKKKGKATTTAGSKKTQ
jgi:hypothetical protein